MKTRNRYLERKIRNGSADRYGTYQSGRLVTPETINGRSINRQLPSMELKKESN
jgi:hypothetical protein